MFDQSACLVFATFVKKPDVCESLGCSMDMWSGDVVVSYLPWFLFVRPTHIHLMIETNVFTASRCGIAENN